MATNGNAPVGVSKNIKQIGRMDLPGGGSVVVENGYAYVGHMDPPHGTSIIDVKDPKNPKLVAHLEIPEGLHSHKVRVSGDIMLINYERYKGKQRTASAASKIFDISDRTQAARDRFLQNPRQRRAPFHLRRPLRLHFADNGGLQRQHRHDVGYEEPRETGGGMRWWMPGQWTAGGETATWHGTATRCHHPIRSGDRLYISYWHGGFAIVDISNMSKPQNGQHARLEPALSLPDAHDFADAEQDHGARLADRHRRRGRREAERNSQRFSLGRRYHQGRICRCRSRLSSCLSKANRRVNSASAPISRPNRFMAIHSTSPGSAAVYARSTSPIRTSLRKSAITFPIPAKTRKWS